ncbi:MAG TPA: hypothetical protein VK531_00015 [Gemmatimonadales bacterium]|nr:hypothetical protein [Gemmatimonadales bacterium]
MQRSLQHLVALAALVVGAACSKPAPQQQQAAAADLSVFATGGVTVLLGTKTN